MKKVSKIDVKSLTKPQKKHAHVNKKDDYMSKEHANMNKKHDHIGKIHFANMNKKHANMNKKDDHNGEIHFAHMNKKHAHMNKKDDPIGKIHFSNMNKKHAHMNRIDINMKYGHKRPHMKKQIFSSQKEIANQSQERFQKTNSEKRIKEAILEAKRAALEKEAKRRNKILAKEIENAKKKAKEDAAEINKQLLQDRIKHKLAFDKIGLKEDEYRKREQLAKKQKEQNIKALISEANRSANRRAKNMTAFAKRAREAAVKRSESILRQKEEAKKLKLSLVSLKKQIAKKRSLNNVKHYPARNVKAIAPKRAKNIKAKLEKSEADKQIDSLRASLFD